MKNPGTGCPVRSGRYLLALALIAPSLAVPALASGPAAYQYEAAPTPYAAPASYAAPEASWSGSYAGVSLGYACCGRDRVQLAPAPPGVIGTSANTAHFWASMLGGTGSVAIEFLASKDR